MVQTSFVAPRAALPVRDEQRSGLAIGDYDFITYVTITAIDKPAANTLEGNRPCVLRLSTTPGRNGRLDETADVSLYAGGAVDAFTILLRKSMTDRCPRVDQTYVTASLPITKTADSWMRVLAGTLSGARSPLQTRNSVFIVHFGLSAFASLSFPRRSDRLTLLHTTCGSAITDARETCLGQTVEIDAYADPIVICAGAAGFEGLLVSVGSAISLNSHTAAEQNARVALKDDPIAVIHAGRFSYSESSLVR